MSCECSVVGLVFCKIVRDVCESLCLCVGTDVVVVHKVCCGRDDYGCRCRSADLYGRSVVPACHQSALYDILSAGGAQCAAVVQNLYEGEAV